MGRRRIVNGNINLAANVFLERFFGEYNQLKLGQIERGEQAAGLILPWIDRLRRTNPLPTILPRKFEDARGITRYNWYAVAATERDLRDLSEDLTAFIGPTWSTFRGERASLDTADPTELAVQEFTNGRVFRFSGNTKKIWESLELMRHVWEKRKTRGIEDYRPSGRVLRDFYMALQASNRESAENALQYLQDRHGYDAINISFLKVQMLAQLDCWGELLASPSIADILQIRRPLAVTQALITALYRQELTKYEEQLDATGAQDYFRREVLPRYGSLFSARAGMRDPQVVKSFMLFAVSAEPPSPELRDELITQPNLEEADRIYLQHLANLLASPPASSSQDILQQAIELFWKGDHDRAFRLAVEAPASLQRTQILLYCAFELQNLASEQVAMSAFNELSPKDQESLQATRSTSRLLESLRGEDLTATHVSETATSNLVGLVPENWLMWLTRLFAEPTWSRAMDVARQGAGEWDLHSLVDQPNGFNQLVEQLNFYPPAAEATLHNCLPFFLEFFRKDDEYPRRQCTEVYKVLTDVLTISTHGGDDDLLLFNELVLARLSLGIETPEYIDLLTNAEDLWERYASPSKVDWILDLLDSLVIYPSPAEGKRSKLLIFAANKFTQFARRIEPAQWNFLALLVRDLHQESLLPLIEEYRVAAEETESVAVDVLTLLAGKSITIYTLTEAVAQRVKSIIQSICSNTVVHLCHDKVGSERLRQLARNSDYFIMATASAKHAATGFIEANRPENLPLLRPSGKGSASMLRTLRSYLGAAATV